MKYLLLLTFLSSPLLANFNTSIKINEFQRTRISGEIFTTTKGLIAESAESSEVALDHLGPGEQLFNFKNMVKRLKARTKTLPKESLTPVLGDNLEANLQTINQAKFLRNFLLEDAKKHLENAVLIKYEVLRGHYRKKISHIQKYVFKTDQAVREFRENKSEKRTVLRCKVIVEAHRVIKYDDSAYSIIKDAHLECSRYSRENSNGSGSHEFTLPFSKKYRIGTKRMGQ